MEKTFSKGLLVQTDTTLSPLSTINLDDDAGIRKPGACAFLDISPATLDRWVSQGILKRRKIGRCSLYRLGDLRALVRNAGGDNV